MDYYVRGNKEHAWPEEETVWAQRKPDEVRLLAQFGRGKQFWTSQARSTCVRTHRHVIPTHKGMRGDDRKLSGGDDVCLVHVMTDTPQLPGWSSICTKVARPYISAT